MRKFPLLLTLALALPGTGLGATAKTVDAADVAPAGLKASVSTPAVTLVLLTSPDTACRHCIGQAELFDAFARTHTEPLRMRRVAWSPWHRFPSESHFPEKVYGLPTWQVFRDGRLLGDHPGQIKDVAVLQKFLADAVNGRLPPKPAPQAAAPSPSRPPVAANPPLTGQERQTLSVMVRRDLARAAFQQCGKAHPTEAPGYAEALKAYELRHEDALRRGALLLFTRTGAGSASEMHPIVEAETRRLRDEAPMDTPTLEGCRKVAQALGR
jgi:hypothetical protein